MFDKEKVLETIDMIRLHNFDIRTVTLAVSLRDCISEDITRVCDKIAFKLKSYAENLVNYASIIEDNYSIPIVNKRISVTPVSILAESALEKDYLKIDSKSKCLYSFYTLIIAVIVPFMFNYKDLQVHHIIPLEEDYSKRLDSTNLITLCPMHHKKAEQGIITKEELFKIIQKE